MPRLLDLYSCAGGAGMGYHRAGFEVYGVDIVAQPRYPFHHVVGDALEVLARLCAGEPVAFTPVTGDWEYLTLDDFDAIHASPPCQAYSVASQGERNAGKEYPDLLAPTREALLNTGRPWIIENVPGAPMRADYVLCGCYFGLRVRRERWFEVSWDHPDFDLMAHDHSGPTPLSVVGHGTPSWARKKLDYNPTIADYRAAMGMDWTNRDELSQAIPPAYTEYLGRRMLESMLVPNHTDRSGA